MKLKYIFYILIFMLLSTQYIDAQEKVVSKCSESFDSYAKIYKECQRGDDLADLFVPTQVDAFEADGLENEMSKLYHFAVNYLYNSNAPAFIVVYGGKINKFGEIEERSKRVVSYLTQNQKVPRDRFVLVNGGFRERFEFELWIGKTKDGFPPLSPTVKRENVIFKGKMESLPTEIGFLN